MKLERSLAGRLGFRASTRVDPMTGRSLWTYRHRCGFVLNLLPMPGFTRRFAAITVPFGSVHSVFRVDDRQYRLPQGSAHFLEHCIFSRDEEGGLIGRLSALGASANAYTSHAHTLYYCVTADSVVPPLELYLQTLLTPDLSAARIEAERPIIQAELAGYRDEPEARGSQLLLENLFHHHPVREDIGGCAESVAALDNTYLETAWRHFYAPSNLSLTVSGDIDTAELLAMLAVRLSGAGDNVAPQALFADEPADVSRKFARLRMPVEVPLFYVGYKDAANRPRHALTGPAGLESEIAAQLIGACLLSPATALYDTLFNRGAINDSFFAGYESDAGFAYFMIGGEAEDPLRSAREVRLGLARAIRDGVDRELFAIQKKAAAGAFLEALDSVEQVGMVQARAATQGVGLFDYPKIYAMMSPDLAVSRCLYLTQPAACATALILSSGGLSG